MYVVAHTPRWAEAYFLGSTKYSRYIGIRNIDEALTILQGEYRYDKADPYDAR